MTQACYAGGARTVSYRSTFYRCLAPWLSSLYPYYLSAGSQRPRRLCGEIFSPLATRHWSPTPIAARTPCDGLSSPRLVCHEGALLCAEPYRYLLKPLLRLL